MSENEKQSEATSSEKQTDELSPSEKLEAQGHAPYHLSTPPACQARI